MMVTQEPPRGGAPRIWLLGLHVLAVLTFLSGSAGAARAADTLHVILAGDSNDGTIGQNVRREITSLDNFFRAAQVRPDGKAITVEPHVVGADFNLQAIEAAIRRLPQNGATNRSVFLYVSCHGAYDATNGHGLSMRLLPADPVPSLVPRAEILSSLAAARFGLNIFVTESCSIRSSTRPRPPVFPFAPPDAVGVIRPLFFDAAGTADINACSEGELAWGYPDGSGSFFSEAFLFTLSQSAQHILKHPTAVALGVSGAGLTWRRLQPYLSDRTEALFKAAADQQQPPGSLSYQGVAYSGEHPQAFCLPFVSGVDKRRFAWGATFRASQQAPGVEVTTSTNPLLRANDLITRIDGKQVRSMCELDCNTQLSSGKVAVSVRRGNAEEVLYIDLVPAS